MSDGDLQSGTLVPVMAQLAAVALLFACHLQQWLALRLTNPCAAYALAWTHVVGATQAVGRRAGVRL